MAQAYTPGLKRKELCVVRKVRTLPIQGEVLVKEGDKVSSNTVVARTSVPGRVHVINAALLLDIERSGGRGYDAFSGAIGGIEPREAITTFQQPQSVNIGAKTTPVYDLERYMLKKEGEHVAEGEIIGMKTSFFGLFKKTCLSPAEGTIETISQISGQTIMREPPVLVNVNAYIPGVITDVLPREGAVIETPAAFVQGIFGIGGETHGEIKVLVRSANDVLTAQQITDDCAGKVVVGGATNLEALRKSVDVGVKGIIVGSIDDKDLIDFLGYDVGVAITGHEDIGLTLILTEGFGELRISDRTFELLKKFDGKAACINGATQVRAGVVRPEIIIPRNDVDGRLIEVAEESELLKGGMKPGMLVRIIREPHFGAFGHIISLPIDLQSLETESKARVIVVDLEDGKRITVPRANVEIIEEQLLEHSNQFG